jgi:hypothetical protein
MKGDIVAAVFRQNAFVKQKLDIPLSREELLAINRYLMFGEDDEAFPDENEWSSIVD